MAVTTLAVQSSTSMVCCEKCLRSGLVFEAQRGYRSCVSKNMRFKNVIFPTMSKILLYRSKHKFAEKLLEQVEVYGGGSFKDRSKLLYKVSAVMGYDGLEDRIDDGGSDDVDISLMCKKFPSISLGSSSRIELYDPETTSNHRDRGIWATKICREFLSSSIGEKLVTPDSLYETWQILYSEATDTAPRSYVPDTLETEIRQDSQSTVNKVSSPLQLEVEIMLDQSISLIPGLSKRNSNQLEKCGFHTLRKLLQHFPRTYADLQNAQVGIEDGQYLIFVGKVVSSRGVKATYSLSFLEVVVACDVIDNASSSASRDDGADLTSDRADNGKKKMVLLHLKKFFQGTRFTYLPFLKRLEEKQNVGDIVCVSGKVRTMRSKNHYEMREYNMDVLQDEKDPTFRAQGRPYPIYPSKGGLSANFLRDVISRLTAL